MVVKPKNRSWQSWTVRRAFEILNNPDSGARIPAEVVEAMRELSADRNGLEVKAQNVRADKAQRPGVLTAYRQAIQAVTPYVAGAMAIFYAWLNGPAHLSHDWLEFWNQEDVRYAMMMSWCALIVTPQLASEYREVLVILGLGIVAMLLYAGFFGGMSAMGR